MNKKIKSKITPIIGLQWGDEGKGKGVARIASSLNKKDLIVRFQGGNNAGHTIWHDGQCYIFHLIPSGVFGQAQIHLGAGMVINPGALLEESNKIPPAIDLRARPKKTFFLKRMSVSSHAVLTLPTHLLLDTVSEYNKGKKKIGSTGKGISPSYTDLTLRRALRVGDIFYEDFKNRYDLLCHAHKRTLRNDFGHKMTNQELRGKEKEFFEGVKFLRSIKLKNSSLLVLQALSLGKK